MASLWLLALAAFAATTAAKVCVNITIPMNVTARNAIFDNWDIPITNLDVTTFAMNGSRQGHNGSAEALTGYADVSGSYKLSAKYCTPNNGSKSSIIQLLTHGIGFDKTYWDMSFNNYNYSYLNTAVDGYCYDTLTYDRLGIGNSTHGDPRNEIQIYLEVAALAELTNMVRNGDVPGINKTYEKVIHVGHSFGSMQSYFLTALHPNISDGLVLTGFGGNFSYFVYYGIGADLQQAALNQPYRFGNSATASVMNDIFGCANLTGDGADDNANIAGNEFSMTDFFVPTEDGGPMYDYSAGYMITKDVSALQFSFLYPPYFDPDITSFGEARKQPVTMGEVLTLGALPMTTPFVGPVLVFTGSNDVIFCGGDCMATGGALPSVPSVARVMFPNATSFESYIQPNTGHGCAFHYNATAGYEYMNDWLASQGLGVGA